MVDEPFNFNVRAVQRSAQLIDLWRSAIDLDQYGHHMKLETETATAKKPVIFNQHNHTPGLPGPRHVGHVPLL
jgi:hypothetical protein